MVLVGKGVKVSLFVMDEVLQALVDWSAAVPDLLHDSLQDDHVTDHRVLQHIYLQDA